MTHISTQAEYSAAINDNGCLLSMLLPISATFPRRSSFRIRRVQFLEWILILFRKHNIEPSAPMKPFTIKYLTKNSLSVRGVCRRIRIMGGKRGFESRWGRDSVCRRVCCCCCWIGLSFGREASAVRRGLRRGRRDKFDFSFERKARDCRRGLLRAGSPSLETRGLLNAEASIHCFVSLAIAEGKHGYSLISLSAMGLLTASGTPVSVTWTILGCTTKLFLLYSQAGVQ